MNIVIAILLVALITVSATGIAVIYRNSRMGTRFSKLNFQQEPGTIPRKE